ncbi:CobD/CbiB family cobalamin biosynthesis protein [Neptunomonas japonica]|uniref:CobD/CbiB family cobalamin biosynthesis protein n=1 Tax=Neptunomonas japonica TaxID=417574 RepID=UPI0003F5CF1D|nr:CobD/CbiB family cobalamin biosynthesis protein [Neptunomonas japonica]
MISATILLGVLIDWLVGEPKRWHPLVGFGWIAKKVECIFNLQKAHSQKLRSLEVNSNELLEGLSTELLVDASIIKSSLIKLRLLGALAVALVCLPLPLLLHYWLSSEWESFVLNSLLNALLLYLALGHRSLWDHIQPIADALFRQDDASARHHTAMIVSRDPEALNIEVSAIESVLENGSDAIFGAIFWFVIAGGAGAIFYRLVNTLDAMWGYRTERYCHFGYVAAKLDDLLNYLPARCTALSYAILSNTRKALMCWKNQASAHASPNGGPVIAAGAGGLGVLLGGPTRYHGVWHDKPVLGTGELPKAVDLQRAMRLVSHSLILWICLIGIAEFVWFFFINIGGKL